jgi:hypothetical protein
MYPVLVSAFEDTFGRDITVGEVAGCIGEHKESFFQGLVFVDFIVYVEEVSLTGHSKR